MQIYYKSLEEHDKSIFIALVNGLNTQIISVAYSMSIIKKLYRIFYPMMVNSNLKLS